MLNQNQTLQKYFQTLLIVADCDLLRYSKNTKLKNEFLFVIIANMLSCMTHNLYGGQVLRIDLLSEIIENKNDLFFREKIYSKQFIITVILFK